MNEYCKSLSDLRQEDRKFPTFFHFFSNFSSKMREEKSPAYNRYREVRKIMNRKKFEEEVSMEQINDLDPKTDWVFKRIFTEEGEKSNIALLSFLNAMLEDKYGKITTADIMDSELTKMTKNAKTYHLDILVKTDNKLLINIEMQNFPKKYFIKRSQIYIFEIMRQMIFFDSAENTSNEESSQECAISLSVCNFNLKESEKKQIIQKNAFMDYIYLEIPKIIAYTKLKSIDKLSKKELWCRFLAYNQKDKDNGTIKELCNLDEGIKMAQQTIVKVTKREREIARELAEFKYNLTLKYEREEGHSEGYSKGFEDGEDKGAHQQALETAKILKTKNIDLSTIEESTGLTIEEIKHL